MKKAIIRNKSDVIDAFLNNLERDRSYQEAVQIVKENALGRIWLVGSGLYGNMISVKYGTRPQNNDWDFVVEEAITPLQLPANWRREKNRSGTIKLVREDISKIDLIPIDAIKSFERRFVEPTIENYLTGVPLTIQSCAMDLETKEIIGDKFWDSLETQIIRILDPTEALEAAKIKFNLKEDNPRKSFYPYLVQCADKYEFHEQLD